MTPFQLALLVQFIVVIAVGWVWGGHVERRVTVWILLVELLSGGPLPTVWYRGVLPVEVVLDTAFTMATIRLALTGNRWWPFGVAGTLLLMLTLHVYVVFQPEVARATYISAQIGLAALLFLMLPLGVFERILAGEPPLSPGARWRRRKAA